jgi:acyl-homoserine lactone acylase PvdQ
MQDMKEMQLDFKDNFAAEVIPKMLNRLEKLKFIWSSDVHEKIISKLKNWDYVMGKTSIEAAFYQVWEYLLLKSWFKLVGLTEEEVQAITNHGYFENYQFSLL